MNLLLLISFIDKWHSFFSTETTYSHLFRTWITILTVTILICFVVGELTRNFSQVDKIWSIMPIVYALVTLSSFPNSPRVWIMSILVTIWGLRLSYNFYRKGGYHIIPWKGEEDYRWNVLRQNPKLQGFRTTIFNLLFISFFQQVLIMLFSTPLLLAAKYPQSDLSLLDYIAAAFMLLFILIETLSDNHLFDFHLQKQNKKQHDGRFNNSLEKGFMVDHFWKYVRHPNFAAEQSIWVSFYLFSVAASGQWMNWTMSGAILLILLFKGSAEFTESISRKKYPEYEKYQQSVPRFLPLDLKKNNYKSA